MTVTKTLTKTTNCVLEPKSGGARPKKCSVPPLSLRTGAPRFQIRSGATALTITTKALLL